MIACFPDCPPLIAASRLSNLKPDIWVEGPWHTTQWLAKIAGTFLMTSARPVCGGDAWDWEDGRVIETAVDSKASLARKDLALRMLIIQFDCQEVMVHKPQEFSYICRT